MHTHSVTWVISLFQTCLQEFHLISAGEGAIPINLETPYQSPKTMGKLALQDLRILIWWQINPEWCRAKDKLILVTRYPLKTLFLATQAQVQDWQWMKGEACRLTTNMMYFHWCVCCASIAKYVWDKPPNDSNAKCKIDDDRRVKPEGQYCPPLVL